MLLEQTQSFRDYKLIRYRDTIDNIRELIERIDAELKS